MKTRISETKILEIRILKTRILKTKTSETRILKTKIQETSPKMELTRKDGLLCSKKLEFPSSLPVAP